MKRIQVFAFAAFFVSIFLTACFAQESLGDAARRARMQKSAPPPGSRVIDNENIPTSGGLGVARLSSSSTANTGAGATNDKANAPAEDADKTKADASSDANSEEAKQKIYEQWRAKIEDQKKAISQLERELNVLQREAQIKATVFYADAGTRLRDPQKYTQEVKQNRDDTAARQKALDDAKQKLADMQEEARKAGVPASYIG